MYEAFQKIAEDSQMAYEYAETHYEELMRRNVSHILYGPPSYGPGAGFPSRRLTKDHERILKPKTRRKVFKAYYFDSNWDLLYIQDFGEKGLSCTLLHFWIGNTNYARYFLRDTNDFYSTIVFSTHYDGAKPIYCAFADPCRIYAEYFHHKNEELIEYSWYDYYPNRKLSEKGTPLTKEAPFGAEDSPVSCGSGFFEPQKSDFLFHGLL